MDVVITDIGRSDRVLRGGGGGGGGVAFPGSILPPWTSRTIFRLKNRLGIIHTVLKYAENSYLCTLYV